MSAKIIDGRAISTRIRTEVARDVAERKAAGQTIPGLATVLVGDDPASHTYVNSKHRACEEAGINSLRVHTGGRYFPGALGKPDP